MEPTTAPVTETEWAETCLETLNEALPEGLDALVCIVASADDTTAKLGVALVPGLDRTFAAKMLAQLAKQYAEEAGVAL